MLLAKLRLVFAAIAKAPAGYLWIRRRIPLLRIATPEARGTGRRRANTRGISNEPPLELLRPAKFRQQPLGLRGFFGVWIGLADLAQSQAQMAFQCG